MSELYTLTPSAGSNKTMGFAALYPSYPAVCRRGRRRSQGDLRQRWRRLTLYNCTQPAWVL